MVLFNFAKASDAWLELINNASKSKPKRQYRKKNNQTKNEAKNFGNLDYNKIFQSCKFLQYVKINSSEIKEPIWFIAINMLSADINSDYIIHWLSEDNPNYSYEETQNKIAYSRASGKFCGCNFIARNYYEICKGCTKAEQIIGRR